uniref:Uncharacterized protein n=1 Tax=Setaria viridis TaxID=4556 RepID=A0A4U6V5L1_SETVI|nr:hypothetical protein SEVIR_3G053000v2 [Setaria viridis]
MPLGLSVVCKRFPGAASVGCYMLWSRKHEYYF